MNLMFSAAQKLLRSFVIVNLLYYFRVCVVMCPDRGENYIHVFHNFLLHCVHVAAIDSHISLN